jgi:hypothetical protein
VILLPALAAVGAAEIEELNVDKKIREEWT